ncbi:MAG: hypothetical protein ABR497_07175 [Kiritimatiellia bacterium]|nr:hypothetical protein [Lentisphaerota bacterium]
MEDSRKPIEIGTRRELFIDDFLIEEMRGGAMQRLQQPLPREAVLPLDQPWERGGYITVFKDGGLYRMYYMGLSLRDVADKTLPRCGDDDLIVCYAQSRDGISWERPSLGLFSFNGSRDNNIVWCGKGSHGFAPFIDTRPGCPPDQRYKAFGRSRIHDSQTNAKWRGLYLLTSADALHWSVLEGPRNFGAVLDRDVGHYDSQNVAFWDELHECYRLYFRWRRPVERQDLVGRDDGEGGRSRQPEIRDTATGVSDDLINWRDLRLLEYPGAPLQEMYTNQVAPYPRASHIYLGFPTRYTENRGPLTDWHRKMMLERPGRYFQSYTDGLLMSSRDGRTFHRWNEAFLRPGLPEESRWGYGECYQSWGMLETATDIPGAPNEYSVFVTEGRRHADHSVAKGSLVKCIRRHTLRLDGFVSVNAPWSGGELLTRPLVFTGERLLLNMSTSAAGSLRVELQDPEGRPLPGFALEDCPQYFGNNLERDIRWSDPARKLPEGRPVRLRFVLEDSDLFAMRFV